MRLSPKIIASAATVAALGGLGAVALSSQPGASPSAPVQPVAADAAVAVRRAGRRRANRDDPPHEARQGYGGAERGPRRESARGQGVVRPVVRSAPASVVAAAPVAVRPRSDAASSSDDHAESADDHGESTDDHSGGEDADGSHGSSERGDD